MGERERKRERERERERERKKEREREKERKKEREIEKMLVMQVDRKQFKLCFIVSQSPFQNFH